MVTGIHHINFIARDLELVLVQPTRADGIPGRHLAVHGGGFFLCKYFRLDEL